MKDLKDKEDTIIDMNQEVLKIIMDMKEAEWRIHNYEDRHQNVGKPYLPFVKLPSFSGEGDPNVYLGWKAKLEQIFYVHEVQNNQKVRLASLEFMDYAMQWWHKTLMEHWFKQETNRGLLGGFKRMHAR